MNFTIKPLLQTLRFLLVGATFVILSSTLWSGLTLAAPPSARAPALRVGFIGPFSGSNRELGLAAREGFEIALRKQSSLLVQTFYEDDEGDGVKSLAAFHKLRKQHKVDTVVAVGDHGSGLLSTAADEFHIPTFLWASLGRAKGPETLAIQTKIDAFLEGRLLAHEAGRRGYKRIAIAYSPTSEFEKVLQGFRSVVKPEQIVSEEKISSSPEDLTTFLESARSKHATALGLFLNTGHPSFIARETRAKAFLADLFGTDSLLSHEEVRLSRDSLLGSWCVGIDANSSFRTNYMQRFREGAFVKVAAVHHDLALALLDVADMMRKGSDVMELIVHSSAGNGVLKAFQIARVGSRHSVVAPLTIYEATEDGFRRIKHPPEVALQ